MSNSQESNAIKTKQINIKERPAKTVLSDYITICELDSLNVIRVIHPKATAAISLFGGHILSFQATGKEDAIWMSEKADFSATKAIRGGIPICWPWFGKAAEPSHGFARTSQWTLNEHRENDDGVLLSLTLQDSAETRAIWPHSFNLELLIEITDKLNVSLITTNTGKTTIQIGGALHSYLKVDDIGSIKISGLGHQYIEHGETQASSGIAVFNQELDRIYIHPDKTVLIASPKRQHNLAISNCGHNAVVVWNPWQLLSASMSDMTLEGYRTMVCVESCNYDRSIMLNAGEQHILSTTISNI